MTIKVEQIINPDLESMSKEELLELVTQLRRRRGIKKVEPVKEKAPAKGAKSRVDQLKALLEGMSDADRKAVLGE